jgi:hypothetical protein
LAIKKGNIKGKEKNGRQRQGRGSCLQIKTTFGNLLNKNILTFVLRLGGQEKKY